MPGQQSRLLRYDDTVYDDPAEDLAVDDTAANAADSVYNDDDDAADYCAERRESARRTVQFLRYRKRSRPGRCFRRT